MNSISTDRWNYWARHAGVALCYVFLYKISLIYATADSHVTLIWLPGGMALAALLLGGSRFWSSIFVGAFGVSLLTGNGWLASVASAAGSTAEPLLGAWLLRRAGFDPALRRAHDFFKLMFLAGLLSPAVSALTGVGTLVLNGVIDASAFLPDLLYWWMGDMLSIILITPLILVWRQPLHGSLRSRRTLELALLLALVFLSGQIVFLDWLHDSIGLHSMRLLIFIFLAWAAVRFGRHGALLVLAVVLTQALCGMLLGVGYFGASMTPSGLTDFWLYFSELVVLGPLLATTIGERRASEIMLRDSEQRWNLALTGIGDGLWDWNPQSGATYVSGQWQKMFGYAAHASEISVDQWRSLVHPDDLPGLKADLHAYLRGDTPTYSNEHRMLCCDGSWKWVLARGAVVSRSADGRPLSMGGTHTDQTARRQLDSALRTSEARFAAFMANLPGIAYIKDAEHRVLYANKLFPGAPVMQPSDYLGKKLGEFPEYKIPPQTLAQAIETDLRVLNQRKALIAESTVIQDGEELTMMSIKFPLTDADGCTMVGGIMLDVSESKRAETRIRQLTRLHQAHSEVNQHIMRLSDESALFQLVCKTAVEFGGMMMAWIGRRNEHTGLVEPVACYGQQLGYLDDIVISTSADVPEGRGPSGTTLREGDSVIINRYHDDPLTAPWRERALRHGINAAASFPIRRAGAPFAALSVYSERPDAFDRESIRLLEGICVDISFALDNFDREQQRREALHALADREQHFRAFFERSMIGMASCTTERSSLEVNDTLCQMLGYSRQELLLIRWTDLTHPDDRHADIAPFERALTGEIDDYEIDKRYLHKNGNIVHAHVAVRGLRKPDHSIDYFVVLVQDVTEKKQSEELIWKQANFDALTGLVNRRMLRDRLEQDLKLAQRGGHSVALLFIDLDRFKEVNDALGHAAGDMLLIEAARRIGDCVRGSDTVARLGGDEFMVILAQLNDTDHVDIVAKNILTRLLDPFQIEQDRTYVSASIGITVSPSDGSDADSLLKNADQAMYVAKSEGRNRFSYFTNALQEAAQHRLRLITDLRGALAGDQLSLHFQPIVELATGHIFKAEALLRWKHPQRGMVGPAEFIPLAEETGLINPIGSWVFREAARCAKRWAGLHGRGVQVSVNMSPVQFRAEAHDSRALIGYLTELQLPRNSIAIEITEGLLLHAEAGVTDRLRIFRDAGIEVAIDDFGTGYSSLSYLKKFDIDYLKIDQSFIRNLTADSDDMALSEAIIVMAHKLGLKVIAEGVETEQQRALLCVAGCDYAQGYLFSKPLPPQQFEALLGLE